jgi:hypothetical protein
MWISLRMVVTVFTACYSFKKLSILSMQYVSVFLIILISKKMIAFLYFVQQRLVFVEEKLRVYCEV